MISVQDSQPETSALLASLTSQRNHVLGILDGLSHDQLRQPVLPSGWSCLGMVQHLTISDERLADGLPAPAVCA